MTLGAMVAHPEISVKIIPVGLNYFGGDRFRSRIYVDYGRYARLGCMLRGVAYRCASTIVA